MLCIRGFRDGSDEKACFEAEEEVLDAQQFLSELAPFLLFGSPLIWGRLVVAYGHYGEY